MSTDNSNKSAAVTTEPGKVQLAKATPAALQNAGGLSTPEQIEALADQLSACADEIHARVMSDIRAHKGAPISEAEQTLARAMLDDILLLRQQANALYVDAATIIVKSLAQSQAQVIGLTVEAAEKVRKITLLRDVAGLLAGLLGLAGAVASGKAPDIVLAIEKIRRHYKAAEAHKGKPGP